MNWTIEYIENDHFGRIEMEGDFDPGEIPSMANELFASDFWQPGMNVLLDHRKIDFGVTEIDTWRNLSDLHVENDAHFGGGKVAFLMKSLPDFARGRQYELLAQAKNIASRLRIFQDETEAVQWLRE